MTKHAKECNLKDITVVHMHTEGLFGPPIKIQLKLSQKLLPGPALYAQEDCKHIFRSKSTFMGGNVRKAVADGRADSIPIFLHEIPLLFRRKIIPVDVALVTVRFLGISQDL